MFVFVALCVSVNISSSGVYVLNVSSSAALSVELGDEFAGFIGWRQNLVNDVLLNVSFRDDLKVESLRGHSSVIVRGGYVEFTPVDESHNAIEVLVVVFPIAMCTGTSIHYGVSPYTYDLFSVSLNTQNMCLFVGDGSNQKLKLKSQASNGVTFALYGQNPLKQITTSEDSASAQSSVALVEMSGVAEKTVEVELKKDTSEYMCGHAIVPVFDSSSMKLITRASPFVLDELTCEARDSGAKAKMILLVLLLFVAVVLFGVLLCCASMYCVCIRKCLGMSVGMRDVPNTVNIRTNDQRDEIPEIVEEDEDEHMTSPLIQSHEL